MFESLFISILFHRSGETRLSGRFDGFKTVFIENPKYGASTNTSLIAENLT